MKKQYENNARKPITAILFATMMVASVLVASPVGASGILPGNSENGILVNQWSYPLCPRYSWGYFGSSAAIADLGPDVNTKGTEPDSDLEIVNGCDGCGFYSSELRMWVPGLWRCWDSQGSWEWATSTQSDEARGSPAIVDLDGDGYLEIAGGTTSGETVEVMDRFGNWFWTFPDPPRSGNFYYPDGPAIADLDPNVPGLEVVIGNRPFGMVLCFDGDHSDGINDGVNLSEASIPGAPYAGVEGVDWDVLWIYQTGGSDMFSTPAVGDVDNDGDLEVVIGSDDGNVYVLNGANGALEHKFSTGGAVYASAALANLDGDDYLEIVIGSLDGKIYCFEWDDTTGSTEWTFSTGGAVYSSAAIGDVNGDGAYEIVVGSNNGKIYSLSALGSEEWNYITGGAVYSSPALANRGGAGLDVYVGSNDAYLYLLDGDDGSLIDRFLTNGQIRTSPSVADVDGDNKLEIFCYDWSSTDTFWCIEDTGSLCDKYAVEWEMFRHDLQRTGLYPISVIPVYIDIKPGSCPNPLNKKSKGVLPVAVLGTEDFDVTTIDPETILLSREDVEGGVAPIRWSYEDIATPFTGELCDCHELEGDGILDLTLKFSTQELVEKLNLCPFDGQTIPLTITGNLKEENGGTPIKGEDCIWVLNPGNKK